MPKCSQSGLCLQIGSGMLLALLVYDPDVSSIVLKNAMSGTGLATRRSVSPTL